jgi:putative ABC transport system permease protein
MWRLTLKNLWAHKLRLALTGLAVVLGVAFMSGTMVLTDTLSRTFDELFVTANANTDVVVQQPQTVAPEWGELRERVPASLVDDVRAVDGVDTAVGSVQGYAQLVQADGTVYESDLGTVIGANWIDSSLNPFTLSSGHAPEALGQAVLDEATVEREGWALGDTVTVLAKGQPTDLTLVGTATFGDVGGLPGSVLVGTNDATAQALFGEPGWYDSVVVAAADGTDDAALASAIDEHLGAGTYDVMTGDDSTATQQEQFREGISFFSTFLLTFALVALFVGTFIIYNTFSILAAQRSRDLAMLRAVGASRRQLLRSLVVESTAVGLVAGALGLVAGVGMSQALKALLAGIGLELPTGPIVVTTGTIVTAFTVGVVVTVVSAFGPAWKASRIAPMAALRDVAVDRSAVSLRRVVTGVSVTGAGVALFTAGVLASGPGSGSSPLQLLGLGTILTFIGVFVLGPVIARPIMAVLGWPLQRLTGMTGHLARENAARSPRRTAATASALMVGVALVGFITILASSTKASVAEGVEQSFRSDFVVESGAWDQGGFNPSLAASVGALDKVDAVAPLRSTHVGAFGGTAMLQGTDTSVIDELYDLQVTSGSMAAVGPGRVAVKSVEADRQGLAVGDTVAVTFSRTGEVPLEVAAVFDEAFAESYVVDLSTYEANVTDQYDQKVWVGLADGVSPDAGRGALDSVLAGQPNAELLDQTEFQATITDEIDTMLNLIYGLLVLAVVIALIGIANTLALSIHERRREIGLLRAVGMTRTQVRRTVRWESVLIALLGTAMGVILAVGSAWGIVQALASESVTQFDIPGVQLVVITVVAALAGVLAAVGPARRASRLDVLDAISTG